MARGHTEVLLRQLRALTEGPGAEGPTDRALLERFTEGDENAFAALVRRHGQLVLRVSRSILGNHADAEDAFQATFLVLARKAAALAWRDSVAGWLHSVACRVARKARTAAARRQRHEAQVESRRDAEPAGGEITLREA